MAAMEDGIRNVLLRNEELLLKNETRNDANLISKIINDNCIEITEAGQKYYYHNGEIFENADGVLYIMDDSIDLIDLAEDCRLLVYTAARVKKNARTKATCSSIWKRIDGEWKAIFHQRTIAAE